MRHQVPLLALQPTLVRFINLTQLFMMSSLYLRHFLPHTVKLLLNLVYLLPLLPILILQFPIGYLQFLDMLA